MVSFEAEGPWILHLSLAHFTGCTSSSLQQKLLEHTEEFSAFYDRGSAIGEQLGVARRWVVPEIGSGEIAAYCRIALVYMNRLIDEAYHQFFGACFPPHFIASPWPSRIYFETDANPQLGEEWGWAPPPLGPLRRKPTDPEERARMMVEFEKFVARVAKEGVREASAAQEDEVARHDQESISVNVPVVVDYDIGDEPDAAVRALLRIDASRKKAKKKKAMLPRKGSR